MYRFVITVVLALPGLFGGGMVFADCGCGCGSKTCSQPAFAPGQPTFGPGSYRYWDRQNNCWLFFDAATKGTYIWSAAERRYQPVRVAAAPDGGVPSAPSGNAVLGGTSDGHQHDHAAIAAPGGSAGNPGRAELLPSPIKVAVPYGGQKLCPVTDDELGSMGAPIPVTVRGQTIWVCCRGCVAKVQRDPDKYLRKVEAERAGRRPARP